MSASNGKPKISTNGKSKIRPCESANAIAATANIIAVAARIRKTIETPSMVGLP